MQCWSCGALIYLFEDGWTGKRRAELWHIVTCCDRHLHNRITIQHTVRMTTNTFSNHIISCSNIWQNKWWQTLYVVSSVPGFSTWTRIKAWRKLEAIMSGTKVVGSSWKTAATMSFPMWRFLWTYFSGMFQYQLSAYQLSQSWNCVDFDQIEHLLRVSLSIR